MKHIDSIYEYKKEKGKKYWRITTIHPFFEESLIKIGVPKVRRKQLIKSIEEDYHEDQGPSRYKPFYDVFITYDSENDYKNRWQFVNIHELSESEIEDESEIEMDHRWLKDDGYIFMGDVGDVDQYIEMYKNIKRFNL